MNPLSVNLVREPPKYKTTRSKQLKRCLIQANDPIAANAKSKDMRSWTAKHKASCISGPGVVEVWQLVSNNSIIISSGMKESVETNRSDFFGIPPADFSCSW